MDPLLIFDALAVAVLAVAAMWVSGQTAGGRRRRRRPDEPVTAPPSDSTLTSAQGTVAWADGTRLDWDRHVRPVLAREFDNVVGGRRSGAADRQATGTLMFGAELWPLVDPGSRFTQRLERPGPGRATLARILERLEAA